MADDTLSPVGFDTSKIVKTHLEPSQRFAMACAFGAVESAQVNGPIPQAAFVRHVMLLGLEQLGWTEERIIQEYAAYRVRCLHRGEANQFESE